MEFDISGVYGDENMPITPTLQTMIYGTWESPLIDLSDGVEIVSNVRSALIEFEATNNEGNIEVYILLDDEWEGLKDGLVQGARRLNSNPNIMIRVVIRGEIANLFDDNNPILHNIKITLSNKVKNNWSKCLNAKVWEWNKF